MIRATRSQLFPCQVLAFLALAVPQPGFAQSYTITDLNDPSDSYRLAHGINSAGYVVGEYEPTNFPDVRAFWYNHNTNTDLGVLTGPGGFVGAYAYGINDSNQIVGWCYTATGIERAFLYANGSMQNLETLATFPTTFGYSEGYAINTNAQIVGTATLNDTTINHAALWSGSSKNDLGSLGGPTFNSTAFGVNDMGVIVGDSEVTNSVNAHAFSFSNNVMTDLLTLPGGSYSHAAAINDSGVIVGESDTQLSGGGTAVHAFACANGPGSMQDLGTFGGPESSAYGINNAGQIVGFAVNSNTISRAFLYSASRMVDLNDLIPSGTSWTNLEAAVGINDAGQIAGYGQRADGIYHAFLLTPVNLSIVISNVVYSNNGLGFSFMTQTGFTYEGQFTTPLASSNVWQTFTNLPGNGSVVGVIDSTATNGQRYYRVVAH